MSYLECFCKEINSIDEESYTCKIIFNNADEMLVKPIITNTYIDENNIRNIVIGNNIGSCSNMFSGCSNFNQPINIPDNVINCSNMFNRASSFNSPVIIGNNVQNCSSMFRNCINFNQIINIPNNIIDCNDMFYGCSELRDIRFLGEPTTVVNLLSGTLNNSHPINIYCKNLSCLNKTTAETSVTGNAISWAATTNGYYNALTNIYILNNVGWR